MMDVKLDELKQLLVANCMLRVAPEEIDANTPLFGPGSLGLDSIDALQMTVAIERDFGIPIKDPATAREAFRNLNSLQQWLSDELNRTTRTA